MSLFKKRYRIKKKNLSYSFEVGKVF